MKNTVKFPGIIALVAVIVFSFVSCDDNIGGGAGDNLLLTMPVTVLGDYVSNIAEARAAKDFSYAFSWNNASSSYTGFPLSNLINGSPRVEITGSTVNIQLGKPKDEHMREQDKDNHPFGVKLFDRLIENRFCTSDAKYGLLCIKGDFNIHLDGSFGADYMAVLIYVERDATVTYYDEYDRPISYLSYKKGWNWVFGGFDTAVGSISTSTTFPPGYRWVVIDHSFLGF
jgi:hypothetical protein